MVQHLGVCALTLEAQAQPLVGEPRPQKLCGASIKTKKEEEEEEKKRRQTDKCNLRQMIKAKTNKQKIKETKNKRTTK